MKPLTIRRAGSSIAMSILLIGVGIASAWIAFTPGSSADTEVLSGRLAPTEIVQPQTAPLLEGMRVTANFQFTQPRDPFRPLIVEGGVIISDGSGGGNNGGGGQTIDGIVVKLIDVSDVGGVLRARVEVAGVEYDVGVGETFATNFKIVSLDSNSAVILFGDNAFELLIGQEIIK